MKRIQSSSSLFLLFVSLTTSMNAQSGPPEPTSKVVEKDLSFPSPVQWATSAAEVSLLHVAWGPANSPEMLSKGRQKMGREQPSFYPDRPYVLALGFSAKSLAAIPTNSLSISGLVRIKDTDGDIEMPTALTSEGFVPFSGYDIHFLQTMSAEYWDLFPAAPGQKEFLFQVLRGNARTSNAKLSFKIVMQGDDISIVDVSPQRRVSCMEAGKDFAGTIGSSIYVKVHLAGENTTLAGTEQYQQIGKTLRLKGRTDSLGNFVLEERYPEDQVTGIFKGRVSDGCQMIQGYFSKPDGSRLQPFELRQVPSPGTQQP